MGFFKEFYFEYLAPNEISDLFISSTQKRDHTQIRAVEDLHLNTTTNIMAGEDINICFELLDKDETSLEKLEFPYHVTAKDDKTNEIVFPFKLSDIIKDNSVDKKKAKKVIFSVEHPTCAAQTSPREIIPYLFSKQLNKDEILNDIAQGTTKASYKKDHTDKATQNYKNSVKCIQTSLVYLGFNLGNSGKDKKGIDGDYGDKTVSAIKSFQSNYTRPAPDKHKHTFDMGTTPDGIVGKNTLRALDEAVFVGWSYKSSCFCNRDLTADELKNILGITNLFSASNCLLPSNERNYEKLAFELNKTMKSYNISTCLRKAHFLAQCAHESAGFQTTSEFGGSTKSYAPYFGRGLLQLTHGESNYKKYGTYKNKDFIANPDLIANKLENACDVSGWFWTSGCVWGNLNGYADKDDLIQVSIAVNGGLNGYSDRKIKVKSYIERMKIKDKCTKCEVVGVYKYSTSHIKDTRYGHVHKSAIKNLDD